MTSDSFDANELDALVAQLVAIDSTNPELVPGGAGEPAVAAFVSDWLARAGLEVSVVAPVADRPSVVALLRGRGGGRSLMLNAHMDTVGVGGMERPHEPRIEGRRLYGRGSYDMKGSLAAIMVAAAACARAGDLAGDVIVTAVADEEHASLGTSAVLDAGWRADGAIVTEATGVGKVCIAHKGFSWLEIETRGRAAHGSLAEVGIDAITMMGPLLVGLERLGLELAERPHPLLGPGTVHGSLIAGGYELAGYPERCTLTLERRTIPGETDAVVLAQLEDLIARAERPGGEIDAVVRHLLTRDPLEVEPDAPIVRCVSDQIASLTGARPTPTGEAGWMDSALLAAAGIPALVYGPDGDGAHADVEWVDLDEVGICAEVYSRVAREWCA